jgi:hypothetical protein
MSQTKAQYWAVSWGDDDNACTRLCADKVKTAVEAAKYCYGMYAPNMRCVPLGTHKGEALKKSKECR